MVLVRPTTLRMPLLSRASRRPASSFRKPAQNPHFTQRIARRGYASGHGEHKKAGSDLPWAASAIAVTIPSCWWLLQPSEAGHEHVEKIKEHLGVDHAEAEEEADDSKDDTEDASKDDSNTNDSKDESKSEEKDDNKDEAKSDDKGDDDKSEGDKSTETKSQGVDTKDDKPGVKHVQKGGAVPQGSGDTTNEAGEDSAATAKEPANRNHMSGKQEGISNTDTKHSTDLTNDPDKSKKGEGTPETAKAKGTVQPDRPMAESKGEKGQDKMEKK